MIRIVGLSATLPNYRDVATFLRVNPQVGLFYFDSRFRPVPLSQRFIGVKARKPAQQNMEMNQVCYDNLLPVIKDGMQVIHLILSHGLNNLKNYRRITLDVCVMCNNLKKNTDKKQRIFLQITLPRSREMIQFFNFILNDAIGDGVCTCSKCYHEDGYRVERNSSTERSFILFRM